MDNYPKFLASGHNIVLKVEGQEVGAAKSITSNQDFGVEGEVDSAYAGDAIAGLDSGGASRVGEI